MGLAQQAQRYVIAGAGLSAGRDLYKLFKRNVGLLVAFVIFLGAFVLPYRAAFNMFQGYGDRGLFKTIFVTIVWNLILIVIFGFLLALISLAVMGMIYPNVDYQPAPAGAGFSWVWNIVSITGVGIPVGLTGIGLINGLRERPYRSFYFDVTKQNEEFLILNDIRETGGEDVTHYDASDTPLRLLEIQNDRISFMVVGKRGGRAHIKLDDVGRFTEYVPA
jgi:hypothetical protein